MKKLSIIILAFLSINVYANNEKSSDIISEEHYQSPGIKDSHFEFKTTVRKLSKAEMDENAFSNEKKTVKTLEIKSVYAKTQNAETRLNSYVKIWADQSACFRNTTQSPIQYGHRFDLTVAADNRLDAATYFIYPGYEECRNRTGYMTYTANATGAFTIYADTRGTEGSNSKDANHRATLIVR